MTDIQGRWNTPRATHDAQLTLTAVFDKAADTEDRAGAWYWRRSCELITPCAQKAMTERDGLDAGQLQFNPFLEPGEVGGYRKHTGGNARQVRPSFVKAKINRELAPTVRRLARPVVADLVGFLCGGQHRCRDGGREDSPGDVHNGIRMEAREVDREAGRLKGRHKRGSPREGSLLHRCDA